MTAARVPMGMHRGLRWIRRPRLAVIAVVVGVLLSTVFGVVPSSAAPAGVEIRVLSNRADLASGGDALVEVVLPSGVDPERVRVSAGGRDVTSAFGVRGDGRFVGLVTGLALGATDLVARAPGARGAEITIVNHALTGPIFSGPQTQPWRCDTEPQGLGPSEPPFCEAPTTVEYFYRSSDPTKTNWLAYDPENPPSDVARTTTDEGETVPFIVRQETGTLNRAIYAFAVLWDPTRKEPAWASPSASPWNGKVFFAFGGGAAPSHHQGQITTISDGAGPDAFPETSTNFPSVLGRGYAVATQSLGRGTYNTNDVTSAETTMMVKERLAEELGEIRYTISYGCSGGGVNQRLVSAGYPGLLDGMLTACAVVDWYTTGMTSVDCNLLARYFNEVSPHLWANPLQRQAVEGTLSATACPASDILVTRYWYDPSYGCHPHLTGEDASWVYHPTRNPTGVRCTLMDDQAAVFGQRPPERWGSIEKALGRGFAPRPLDNEGVQYGLKALLANKITAEQFVDLNEKIGGIDHDYNYVPRRMQADPEALTIGYRTGRIPTGNTWAQTPVIDLGGNGFYDIHDDVNSHVVRARLREANGQAGNHVIWKHSLGGHAVDLEQVHQALDLMDRWLAAVKADTSDVPLADKVLRNKPSDAVDKCVLVGTDLSQDNAVCRTVFPYGGLPRMAAGGPLTNNVMKCQLRPPHIDDYNGVFPPMSNAQFERLRKAFPNGVCDWTKPGVGFQQNVPWMSFANGPGGQPLGDPPGSKPLGNG